jgi:hypothetical protein
VVARESVDAQIDAQIARDSAPAAAPAEITGGYGSTEAGHDDGVAYGATERLLVEYGPLGVPLAPFREPARYTPPPPPAAQPEPQPAPKSKRSRPAPTPPADAQPSRVRRGGKKGA